MDYDDSMALYLKREIQKREAEAEAASDVDKIKADKISKDKVKMYERQSLQFRNQRKQVELEFKPMLEECKATAQKNAEDERAQLGGYSVFATASSIPLFSRPAPNSNQNLAFDAACVILTRVLGIVILPNNSLSSDSDSDSESNRNRNRNQASSSSVSRAAASIDASVTHMPAHVPINFTDSNASEWLLFIWRLLGESVVRNRCQRVKDNLVSCMRTVFAKMEESTTTANKTETAASILFSAKLHLPTPLIAHMLSRFHSKICMNNALATSAFRLAAMQQTHRTLKISASIATSSSSAAAENAASSSAAAAASGSATATSAIATASHFCVLTSSSTLLNNTIQTVSTSYPDKLALVATILALGDVLLQDAPTTKVQSVQYLDYIRNILQPTLSRATKACLKSDLSTVVSNQMRHMLDFEGVSAEISNRS